MALRHHNQSDKAKCLDFLRFVYGHLESLLQEEQHVRKLMECGCATTIRQLIPFERYKLNSYGGFIAQRLLGVILDYDDPQLFHDLLVVGEFQEELFTYEN